ncbi:MAG: hypothetical protein ACOC9X_04190 [bacterium]
MISTEENRADLLAREWERIGEAYGRMVLTFDPMEAWVAMEALQLALLHPEFSDPRAPVVEHIAETIRNRFTEISPLLADLIEEFYETEYDDEHIVADADHGAAGWILIARERLRQIHEEGYSADHDDQHDGEELAEAAAFYAIPEQYGDLLVFWPFGDDPVRRRKDRVRQLAIAGALIAAEIDRLLRAGAAAGGSAE